MKRGILLIFVILISCSENEIVDSFNVISITESTGTPQIIEITDQVFESLADPQYYLDWEAIDYIPRNPDKLPVPMPWSNLASRKFSDDILYDFKKDDGWVLVANTFTPGETFFHEFFILYNKYRGILRYYL